MRRSGGVGRGCVGVHHAGENWRGDAIALYVVLCAWRRIGSPDTERRRLFLSR